MFLYNIIACNVAAKIGVHIKEIFDEAILKVSLICQSLLYRVAIATVFYPLKLLPE